MDGTVTTSPWLAWRGLVLPGDQQPRVLMDPETRRFDFDVVDDSDLSIDDRAELDLELGLIIQDIQGKQSHRRAEIEAYREVCRNLGREGRDPFLAAQAEWRSWSHRIGRIKRAAVDAKRANLLALKEARRERDADARAAAAAGKEARAAQTRAERDAAARNRAARAEHGGLDPQAGAKAAGAMRAVLAWPDHAEEIAMSWLAHYAPGFLPSDDNPLPDGEWDPS